MKKIVLKSLILSEWKGQNCSVTFGEQSNEISGRNRAGKSTLMKAWQWLLTGYTDANSSKNADLYDNTKELTKDTPKASVKAIITIDGTEYTLERTAEAKFQRRRGTDVWEKSSSDAYKFFVDNIEFSATEFDEWVNYNIADSSMLRFAISGDFFITMVYEDKKRARQIIEGIVGDISDEEIKGEYPIIEELKSKYNIEQIEQQSTNMIKSIGGRLDELPVLIRAKEKELSELKENDFDAIQKDINEKEIEVKTIDRQMFDMSERIKPLLQARHEAETARQMKQKVYDKAKSEYEKQFIEEDNALVKTISEIEERNKTINEKRKTLLNDNKYYQHAYIDDGQKRLEELRQKRDEIKSQTSAICPTCGSKIEGELFKEKQREMLDDVVKKGKELKEQIEQAQKKIEENNVTLDALGEPVDTSELKDKLNRLRTSDILPFSSTKQGQMLQADIDAIQIPDVEMPDNRDLQDHRDQLQSELKDLYVRMGLKNRINDLSDALSILRVEQRTTAEKLGRYERQKMEIKRYRQEQMSILSEKVNQLLHHSCIDIWSTQKDGTVVPDLVLRDANGVNYSTTNGASRLITAIDIQRFFCEKLDVNMPTWVDEASIIQRGNIPQLDDVQMFYMFCADNELKVEYK